MTGCKPRPRLRWLHGAAPVCRGPWRMRGLAVMRACCPCAAQALSAMVKLELPHVNVLTKVDICGNKAGARGGRGKHQRVASCMTSERLRR